jgi:leucyl/phenylalanyl-tRNA---protein transferase
MYCSGDDLPYLSDRYRITFPDPDPLDEYGIVMVGGNLSPGILLSAYEQGVFPWFDPHQPILWWNPPRRCILFPGNYHLSHSMRRFIRRTSLTVTCNTAFEQVIRACKEIPRPGQNGTWLTEDMVEAYQLLHELGYAFSYEVWDGARLAGGLYGLHMGHYFCGESMFTRVSNASKLAFHTLYTDLISHEGLDFIDFQVTNPHSESLGAVEIEREDFLALL